MSEQVTVGVSVVVPEPHATVLSSWRRRVGDPQAGLVWPHVTLLPPTVVPVEEMGAAKAHLAGVAAAHVPFEMHLSGTGTFRPRSPVVYVQVARGVADCEALERAIRTGPLARALEFPYHPHVTIAQDVPDAALDAAYTGLAGLTVRFEVAGFTLCERSEAGRWAACADYALGGR